MDRGIIWGRPGRATTEIKNKIAGVQETSQKTSRELNDIIEINHQVNDISLILASADQQQSAATREIFENISQAEIGIFFTTEPGIGYHCGKSDTAGKNRIPAF